VTERLEELADGCEAHHYLDLPRMQRLIEAFPSQDWSTEYVKKMALYNQGVLKGINFGHFIRWFNGGNPK